MGSMFSSSSSNENSSSSSVFSSLMPGSSTPQPYSGNPVYSVGGRRSKSKANKKTNHKTKRRRR